MHLKVMKNILVLNVQSVQFPNFIRNIPLISLNKYVVGDGRLKFISGGSCPLVYLRCQADRWTRESSRPFSRRCHLGGPSSPDSAIHDLRVRSSSRRGT